MSAYKNSQIRKHESRARHGRSNSAHMPNYHRRSNVETVFAMMKARFGAAVASRLPTAQVNEVLAMCVAHNLCCLVKAIFTAGLAPAFWQDAPEVTT